MGGIRVTDQLRYAFQFGAAPDARLRDPEQPLRILVLGDFSRRAARKTDELSASKPRRVDVDNFDSLLSEMRPTIRIPVGDLPDATLEVEIGDLDDFHPDQLYRNLPVFQQLRQLRKQLLSSDTFDQAAAQFQSLVPSDTDTKVTAAASSPAARPAAHETDADTLQRILGSAPQAAERQRASGIDIDNLIHQIVAPYIEPTADPRRDQYVGSVDKAIAQQMRSILHHPEFQSCESIWRGLHHLISNVETSADLQVYLWDVSRTDLLQAAESESGQLEDSQLFELLITTREQDPYSLFVSAESIEDSEEDIALLGMLGTIAAHSGGPLLASATPSLLGCQSWTDSIDGTSATGGSQAWKSLRTSPVAPWIALSAPRVLLRLPYGAASSPIDAFEFEEIEDLHGDDDSFLWGSPALACGTLVGMSFAENGWQMSLDDRLELDDLPAVTYKHDGESILKPCAEVLLAQRGGEAMLAGGVMPLMSYKNRNAARFLRFQSIAEPLCGLSGPWS